MGNKQPISDKASERPPIVVVLGHVDHGKTSLLDRIRSTNVVAGEAGGITQHIGAYQIETPKSKKKITFIDTPGHAAFAKMRSRGANVADLAILVVSGQEGVKPQTVESIKFIQEAKIPFLVAITKMDLPDVDINKVKNELVRAGVLLEGLGGEVVSLPVSAKTGQGIEEMLEIILLLAEMAGLGAQSEGPLEAVIIESKMDATKGPVASVIVRNGSLKIGDEVWSESDQAKVRAMFDERGRPVQKAFPGQPVELLGFKKVPLVGEKLSRVGQKNDEKKFTTNVFEITSEDKEKPKIILKADTIGTLEAIFQSLPDQLFVLKAEPGNINESDITLAVSSQAHIVGFNVKLPSSVKKLAEVEGVTIAQFKTIYELTETLEKRLDDFLHPKPTEEIIGRAKIMAEFVVNKNDRVAGCSVEEGEIMKNLPFRLVRGSDTIGSGRIKSLRTGKTEVDKVGKGNSCGIQLGNEFDFTIGDMVLSYRKLK